MSHMNAADPAPLAIQEFAPSSEQIEHQLETQSYERNL